VSQRLKGVFDCIHPLENKKKMRKYTTTLGCIDPTKENEKSL
jgi:hypothetical protein